MKMTLRPNRTNEFPLKWSDIVDKPGLYETAVGHIVIIGKRGCDVFLGVKNSPTFEKCDGVKENRFRLYDGEVVLSND